MRPKDEDESTHAIRQNNSTDALRKRTHVVDDEGAAVDTDAKAGFFLTEGMSLKTKHCFWDQLGAKRLRYCWISSAEDELEHKIAHLPSWKAQLSLRGYIVGMNIEADDGVQQAKYTSAVCQWTACAVDSSWLISNRLLLSIVIRVYGETMHSFSLCIQILANDWAYTRVVMQAHSRYVHWWTLISSCP